MVRYAYCSHVLANWNGLASLKRSVSISWWHAHCWHDRWSPPFHPPLRLRPYSVDETVPQGFKHCNHCNDSLVIVTLHCHRLQRIQQERHSIPSLDDHYQFICQPLCDPPSSFFFPSLCYTMGDLFVHTDTQTHRHTHTHIGANETVVFVIRQVPQHGFMCVCVLSVSGWSGYWNNGVCWHTYMTFRQIWTSFESSRTNLSSFPSSSTITWAAKSSHFRPAK